MEKMNDDFFMKLAIEQAETALSRREFPVGCVVAFENEVIATGARSGIADGRTNEVDHAEMAALKRLDEMNPDFDRSRMSIYSTMEPCLMCFAAILLSRIGRIVYAYEDVMGGGTACDLSILPPLYRDRKIEIIPHVMRQESIELFQAFFADPQNDYWADSLLSRYTLEQ